ncbi:MAG: diguanylate cyclase [Oscillospiraceae bacterium]|nr:diguanylate cyclase [Oscillospiraceae bacterium]
MKKNIMIISDSGNFYYITEAIFRQRHRIHSAQTESEALALLRSVSPNLIILTPALKDEAQKPQVIGARMSRPRDSFRFLEKVRKSGERYADTPTILATPVVTADIISRAGKFGVSEIVKLPFDPLVLCDKVEEVLLKFSPSREHPDPVTGLPKKYAGEQSIAELLDEGKKGALMLIDLDHYSFASTSVSDKTLITCRDIIKDETGADAVLAVLKSGGFLLFVPELREKEKVQEYSERLIRKILERVDGEKVFVSVGLAVSERHGKNYEDLYLACDKGLGEARTHGKNIARFYSW